MASVSSHCDLTKKKCLQIDFRCGVQTVFRRKFLARKTRQKATSETFSYFEWPVRTGKSLSEALILASTNPQYDDRLFIELQLQYMKIPSSNPGRTCRVQKLFLTFRTIFVHNMFSPCSAKRRASDKDLPVLLIKNIGRQDLMV